MTFLFTRYGEGNNERVIKEEDKVKNFTWIITNLPVVFYNLINDLETISKAASVPNTINQHIQYGVDIIKKLESLKNVFGMVCPTCT